MTLDRIVRRPEVLKITGLSRATLYRIVAENLFPRPVRIAHNAVGWRESAIREWLESREPVGAEVTRTSGNGEPGGAP